MNKKKRILSGIRPTGKLHLGHWVGVLSNWVALQKEYHCFFMVADWHALMSEYKDARSISGTISDNIADWLAWGIDPHKAVIFVQSHLPQHLELFMLLSIITPLGWLSRCPTFKEQLVQLKDKDIHTYAFLGYPALQAADILLYKAHCVPVGEDQLPHLEITREIARRFHFLYGKEVFVEPQPLLTKMPKLLGIDGRKMSKSYDNFISLDEEERSLKAKVLSMFTDPSRLRKSDPGHPEICNVHSYYKVFASRLAPEVDDWCRNAKKGCKECKGILATILSELIQEKRKAKHDILGDTHTIRRVLKDGAQKAGEYASQTLKEAREAIFD